MIHLDGVKYIIGKKDSPEINFIAPDSSVSIIVGDNGEGKTLLLKTLIGENKFLSGQVSFNDKPVNLMDSSISFCSISDYQFNYMRVTDYLNYLVRNFELDVNKVKSLCELFSINKHLTTPIFKLSEGERRRLSIVETELLDAPVALYDEPEANLDAGHRKIWLEYLKAEMERNTKVIITHYPEIYQHLAHQVYRLTLNDFKPIVFNSKQDLMGTV